MEENVKRVDDRLNDYIKDSNENNIHDIRTATRRLDASFISLPRKMRRKTGTKMVRPWYVLDVYTLPSPRLHKIFLMESPKYYNYQLWQQ